ncbi:hypothetical protein ACTXT7_017074 [Hymenolepis weldensis]
MMYIPPLLLLGFYTIPPLLLILHLKTLYTLLHFLPVPHISFCKPYWFKDHYRKQRPGKECLDCTTLNIFHPHFPPKFNALDEQLVNTVKRLFLVSYEKETVRHLKNIHSRYATLTSEPETGPTEIYLDVSYLPPPWNPKIPDTQRNHRPDLSSGTFRRPWKRFETEPVSEFMDQ